MLETAPGPATMRQIASADLETVLSWRNHPDVRRFMFTQREVGLDEHSQWFTAVLADPKRHALIAELPEGPLGVVNFTELQAGKVADWGFYAVPGAPRGTGALMGAAALGYAFSELGLHKVCGRALAYNESSIRFHQRLGFRQEGLLRGHHEVGGVFHDVVCFGLLREEWGSIRR